MKNHTRIPIYKRLHVVGIMLICIFGGMLGLEFTDFRFGVPIDFYTALVVSTVGGGCGGAMLCPDRPVVGAIGGALSTPSAMLAVMFYAHYRTTISNIETTLIQCLASFPGVAVAVFVMRIYDKIRLRYQSAEVGERETINPYEPPSLMDQAKAIDNSQV